MYKRDRARKLQLLRQKQMASQQSRPQCQIGSEVVGSISAPGAGSSLPYSPSATPGTPLYGSPGGGGGGNGVQIKQELIQIPQLSSSTSSPDSSPSPLSGSGPCGGGAGGQLVNGPVNAPAIAVIHSSPPPGTPHHHPHHQQHHPHPQTQAQAPSEHHKMSWTPHTPTTPTSSTPSPLTASPKAFQYESTAGAQGTAASASNASNGGGGGGSPAVGTIMSKVPSLIREIQTTVMDDKEWQNQLFSLLQNQTYNQCEVDLFELMCKVLDQSLFAQVDWARNSLFFKDLKVRNVIHRFISLPVNERRTSSTTLLSG